MNSPLTDSQEPEAWGERWVNLGKNSFLKKFQEADPEKWQNFYDQVADVWEKVAGIGDAAAHEMVSALAECRIVSAGKSILEIGCGPGAFSLALAAHQCRVTAMDLSCAMIRVLEEKIVTKGGVNIVPLAADWNNMDLTPDHDLVVAAFFPEAFCPEGVSRMEHLAKQDCVLVVGTGGPAFPFYRQIWARVMDIPCATAGSHLTCAENFLKQTGRNPSVYRLSLPAVLDIELEQVRDYYKIYFSMLGAAGRSLDKAIDEVLHPFVKNGHIYLEGQSGAAMICWPVPPKLAE